ncbi:MAG: discoidin domain-containing protein [Verrucomicrobiales bacterium]|nr:discoidin domain-containing protein [Verrucomicrobiales bacterium]
MAWGQTQSREKLKVLLVTGGCCHDYEVQKGIITAGISERCRIPIEWQVIHHKDRSENSRISIYSRKNWADGYDVVIHNECIPKATDPDWIENILQPHRNGVPAVLIHCALLSYPDAKGQWAKFCGAGIASSGESQDLEIQDSGTWKTRGRLPVVRDLDASSEIIAKVKTGEGESASPVAWLHPYGEAKTPVFVSAIGDHSEMMAQPGFLDMLTKGLIRAVGESPEKYFVTEELRELNDRKPLRPGRNLLTGQTTLSSSIDSFLAVDGDPATAWEAEKGEIFNWWHASLSAPVEIDSIAVFWADVPASAYWIEGSNDGRSWKKIGHYSELQKESKIVLHPVEAIFQYIRISNPDTGVIQPLAEVAAYKNRKDIPFHILSSATITGGRLRNEELVRFSRSAVLEPGDAFRLLDAPDAPLKWDLALEELSAMRQDEVVDGLMKRIDRTSSGEFRHLCVSALGRLYRDKEGQLWKRSADIASYIEGLFQNGRFDKEILLAELARNDIQVKNMVKVVDSAQSIPELKELTFQLLSRSSIPYNALSFLTGIVKDPAETMENRLSACAMLARSTDMLAMRDSFEFISLPDNLNKEQREVRQLVVQNTTWEAQLDWLAKKSNFEVSNERILAWEILVSILEDVQSRSTSKTYISDLLDTVQVEDGESFRSLVLVIKDTENPVLKKILENVDEVTQSEDVTSDEKRQTLDSISRQVIEKEIAKVRAGADPEKGETIYNKLCSTCHSKRGVQLAGLSRADLISGILTPNEEVNSGFRTYQFVMQNDKVYFGFTGQDFHSKIEVIDQAGNAVLLEKNQIRMKTVRPFSTMPGNLVDDLTLDEFASLLHYLQSL